MNVRGVEEGGRRRSSKLDLPFRAQKDASLFSLGKTFLLQRSAQRSRRVLPSPSWENPASLRNAAVQF